ncbi:leucine-rich repeat domain-containing protein [Metabacillus malikii]|uniref:LPXTG-motif cell wall-anchored protein/uncharacterized repeat protein (TIGR01451 family) n=1 Tax=Metabacillus malikii TaxID=1504265 RepID=A0ABT9ZIP8_9BACI|nr:leucine-rich repeat domain-containing protein [Metabacillus malikii]MDQ0231423.1 LPXTG-motif cell wall-anchored protein/uncharacterized repeat protein (TIGR01451 family) [Metabacillus malikii]
MKKYKWLNILAIFTIIFPLFSPFSAQKLAIAEEITPTEPSLQLLPIEVEGDSVRLTWIHYSNESGEAGTFELIKNGQTSQVEAVELEKTVQDEMVRSTYTYIDAEVESDVGYTYQVKGVEANQLVSNQQTIQFPVDVSGAEVNTESDPKQEEEQIQEMVDTEAEVVTEENPTETEATDNQQNNVTFEDENLERQIRHDLGLANDEPITKEKLADLTRLFVADSNVTSLEGLENAINLTNLTLSENNISDVSPLKELVNLEHLDLENNEITSIEPLKNLAVQTLFLSHNPITSLEALGEMDTLVYLMVDGTEIASIQELEQLEGLQEVYLTNTPSLEMNGQSAAYAVVQALENRGVYVEYDFAEGVPATIDVSAKQLNEDSNTISWTYSGTTVVSYYRVMTYNTDFNTSEHEYTVSGLEEGQTYDVTIQAYDENDQLITEVNHSFQHHPAPEGEIVSFADENLKNSVKAALGIYEREIYESDMEQLISLHASYQNITSLIGLEFAKNLESLSIYGNQITDLTPLKDLTNISYLDIERNEITSIEALANLTKLQTLWLDDNPIEDISTLAQFNNLTTLYLHYTEIDNIDVLLELDSLTYVSLTATNLSFEPGSADMNVIQELFKRNVRVDYTNNVDISIDMGQITKNSISLSWTTYSEDEYSYVLYLNGEEVASTKNNAYTFEGLTPETDYHIAIHVLNEENQVIDLLSVNATTEMELGEVVQFADNRLEKAVKDFLGIYDGDIYERNLQDITYLNLPEMNISDLTGLEHATNLESLYVWNNNITDVTPLQNLTKLMYVDISDNNITDINPLSGLTNIEQLTLNGNDIQDISSLSQLEHLKHLSFEHTNVDDISALLEMENLESVYMENLSTDISSEMYEVIQTLQSQDVYVSYTNPYENFPIWLDAKTESLIRISWSLYDESPSRFAIYLNNKKIEDINNWQYEFTGLDAKTSYTIRVDALDESGNVLRSHPITVKTDEAPSGKVVDIPDSELKNIIMNHLGIYGRDVYESDMNKLDYLNIYEATINDLTGLEYAKNLESLSIQNSGITNIEPLKGLVNLRHLDLANNEVKDLTPLSSLINLEYLWISNNPIENINALNTLENLYGLDITYTNVEDITILPTLPSLSWVALYGSKVDLDRNSDDWSIIEQLQDDHVDVEYEYHTINSLDIYATEDSATINWAYQSDVERLGSYRISIENGETFTIDKEITEYVLKDLEADTGYYVEIAALDEAGEVLAYTNTYFHTLGEPTGEKIEFKDKTLEEALKRELYLTHRDLYTGDLEQVTGLSLGYEGITELTGLESAVNLEFLYLSGNQITDISVLKSLENLHDLYIDNNNIKNIEALAQLTNLVNVSIAYNPIETITDFELLQKLEYIDTSDTLIDDIQVLANLPVLKYVYLYNLPNVDLSADSENRSVIKSLLERDVEVSYSYSTIIDIGLETVTDNSIAIQWSYTGIEEVDEYVVYFEGEEVSRGLETSFVFENLAPSTEYYFEIIAFNKDGFDIGSTTYYVMTNEPPATGEVVTFKDENLEAAIRNTLYIYDRDIRTSDMENLTYLYLSNVAGVSNLSGLEYAINLYTLDAAFNEIESVEPLKDLQALQSLTLWGNPVADISPLANLTSLTHLDLDDTAVSSVDSLSKLVNLETLYLANNDVNDIAALESLTNLDYLNISGNPIDFAEGTASYNVLNSLMNQGTYVYYDQQFDMVDSYVYVNEVRDTTAAIEWGIELEASEIESVGVYVNDAYIELPKEAYASYTLEQLVANKEYEVMLEVVAVNGSHYTSWTSFRTERSLEELTTASFEATIKDEINLTGLEFTIEGIEASNQDIFYYGNLAKDGQFRKGYRTNNEFNLPYGKYEVIVHGQGIIKSKIEEVEITKDASYPISIALESIEKEIGEAIIKVVDENGEPITELESLSLYSPSIYQAFDYSVGSYYEWGITNANGEYTIADFVYADDYYVNIGAEGYKPFYNEASISKENNELTITLKQGAKLELEVIDANTGAALGATYNVYGNQSYAYGEVQAGSYTIGGLEEENLTVEVSMEGYQTETLNVTKSDFVDKKADLGIVELQREKFIEGKLYKADRTTPATYVYVYLYDEQGNYAGSTRTDTSGYFKLRNVEAGKYTLKTEDYYLPNIEAKVNTDESYYTFYLEEKQEGSFSGDGNLFASSTRTVVPGKTIKYRFDYKNNGDEAVDDASFKIELPDGVTLVKESILVNGEPAVYNKGLDLPEVAAGATGEVTFEATVVAEYTSPVVAANAVLETNGQQFVKSASTNVLFVTINAPKKTATSTIKVYGEAKAGGNVTVEVYDGTVKLASTKVSGRWWYADVALPVKKGEESSHRLYAKIIDGETSNVTEHVEVAYEPSIPTLEDVTIQAGWNKDIKPNPYTGIATFAITEFTQVDFELKFDKHVEKAKIHFIGKEYELSSEDGLHFTGYIPGDWSSYGEQLMEIEFDGIKIPLMEVIVLIDPSGYVFEGSIDNKLSGVTAVVEEKQNNVWKNWNAQNFGQINPQVTGEDGRYGWDVPQGQWRVIFSKDGYSTHISRIVTVPPPETELNVPLIREDDPIVTAVTPANKSADAAVDNSISVEFDRLMNQEHVNENIQVINKATGKTIEGSFTYENLSGYKTQKRADGYIDYVEDSTKKLSSWFEFTPTEPLANDTTYQIVIKAEMADYDGKTLGEDYATEFTTAVAVEEPDAGETPGEGTDEPDAGETPGEGTEEPDTGETPDEGTDEPGKGETPGEGTDEPDTGETPDEGTDEPGTVETPGEGTEEPGTGETPNEGTDEPDAGDKPDDGTAKPQPGEEIEKPADEQEQDHNKSEGLIENVSAFEKQDDIYVYHKAGDTFTIKAAVLDKLDNNSKIQLTNGNVKALIPVALMKNRADATFTFGDVTQHVANKNNDALTELIDFTLLVDGKQITNFASTPITLTFNVNPSEINNWDHLRVYYINENGDKAEEIETSFNLSTNEVYATVTHFSVYGVFEVNSATPVEDTQTPDADKATNTDKTQTIDKVHPVKQDTEKQTELPNTSTNMFNLILLGFIILLIGTAIVFIQKRKNA